MAEEETFASKRRAGYQNTYDHERLVARIQELLKSHNESYREASLRSSLDHQAIRRILNGQRPMITACVLLANHWNVHPNEMLTLAGWPALDIFNVKTAGADKLPQEAVEVALAVAKISDPGKRKQVSDAIQTLLSKYFED